MAAGGAMPGRLLAGAAAGLSLAAAPVLAAMALASAATGGGPGAAFCAALPGAVPPEAVPIDGMAAMYALMALFHLQPWLRLLR